MKTLSSVVPSTKPTDQHLKVIFISASSSRLLVKMKKPPIYDLILRPLLFYCRHQQWSFVVISYLSHLDGFFHVEFDKD